MAAHAKFYIPCQVQNDSQVEIDKFEIIPMSLPIPWVLNWAGCLLTGEGGVVERLIRDRMSAVKIISIEEAPQANSDQILRLWGRGGVDPVQWSDAQRAPK